MPARRRRVASKRRGKETIESFRRKLDALLSIIEQNTSASRASKTCSRCT
jgi:hypothetical protein